MAILEVVSLVASKPEELNIPGSETRNGLSLPFKFCRENNVAGYKGAAYGPVDNEAGAVKALVEWESVDAHLAFGHSDKFMSFVQSFGHIASPTGNFHVDFNKTPFAAGGPCTKGITELAQYTYQADAVPKDAETLFKDYADALADAKLPGFGGYAYGWMLEELDDERIEGGKAKSLVVATGWDSKEDYQKAKGASASTVEDKARKFAASYKSASTSLIAFTVAA